MESHLSNSPWAEFFTSIQLDIPRCKNIIGDSARLDVSLENPSQRSSSVSEYDVHLRLNGSKDSADVTFVAYSPQYTSLTVGSHGIYNQSSLLFTYETYHTVSLRTKDGSLSVYRDGALIASVSYLGTKIGLLKSINIEFKGSGDVDWVKLFNSNTKKKIMQENFNVDGTSTVQWF